jgi:CPA2 family monovalent cation:H+ antiporter-2
VAASINIAAYSDALVVLGTAGVIVPLVKRWGLNPVLGYLAAGAILGPLGLGSFIEQIPLLYWFTVVDAKNVAGIAELGVVFLFFLIGLELSFARLIAMRRLVFGLGGTQIIASTVVIAGVAAATGQTTAVAIVIGVSLALSSTAIVLELLSSSGRLTTSTGRGSFAILLAQDLAVIPILIFVSILGSNTDASIETTILRALVSAVLALAIIVIVGRLLLRPLFRLVANAGSSELFIAALMFVIVGTGVVAALAGVSMALGAFVAGLLLAETEYRKAIEATIQPFKGLLLGVFFFTVGMSIDARELLRYPHLILAATVGLIAAKALIVTAACRLFKLPWPAAVEAGLLLGPGGEFAFVAIGLAVVLGVIDPAVASFTLAVTSLTMASTPMLGALGRHLGQKLTLPEEIAPDLLAAPPPQAKHAIIVGYGRVGQVISRLMRHHGIPYVAVDSDADLVADARRKGHKVFYGNAANAAFLQACGLADARGVVVTTQSRALTEHIVTELRRERPDLLIVARARDASHARHLYAIGVSDAVPETIEASLQLAEAALVGLGVATGPVIASIHEEREVIRKDLQAAPTDGLRQPISAKD